MPIRRSRSRKRRRQRKRQQYKYQVNETIVTDERVRSAYCRFTVTDNSAATNRMSGIRTTSPPPLRRRSEVQRGVQVVDAPPTTKKAVAPTFSMPGLRTTTATKSSRRDHSSTTTLSSDDEDGSDGDEYKVPATTKSTRRPPLERDDDDDSGEASWWGIADKNKMRPPGSSAARTDIDSADSSEHLQARKQAGTAFARRSLPPRREPIVSKLPQQQQRPPPQLPPRLPQPQQRRQLPLRRPPQRFVDNFSDDDDDDSDFNGGGGGGMRFNGGDSDDDDEDDERDTDMMRNGFDDRMIIDPLEEATLKAVRKAKLLARIEQLTGRGDDGVAPSKVFNYKSSEEELLVEVARMEVLADRAIRIEQGRSFLVTTVQATEKGACRIDAQPWFPFHFNLQGFSKQLRKDLWKYDDCLERGVSATLGPGSEREWWVELLFVLIPSMVLYSISNNFSENPEFANEVLRTNPEFQQRMAREVAKEFAHTENKRVAQLEAELQKTRDEVARMQQTSTRYGPAPTAAAPPQQQRAPTTTTSSSAPLRPLPTTHPLGDYPVDAAQTREMQALIDQNNDRKNAETAFRAQITNQVVQGVQDAQHTLLEQQRRDAARQQKLLEYQLAREKKRPIPPPPSAAARAPPTVVKKSAVVKVKSSHDVAGKTLVFNDHAKSGAKSGAKSDADSTEVDSL